MDPAPDPKPQATGAKPPPHASNHFRFRFGVLSADESASGVAAVDGHGDADDEAGAGRLLTIVVARASSARFGCQLRCGVWPVARKVTASAMGIGPPVSSMMMRLRAGSWRAPAMNPATSSRAIGA
jgi:hypothetical protein